MRRAILVVLAVSLLGADEQKADSKKDLEQLKGTWNVESITVDGAKKEDLTGGKFTFDGDKMMIKLGDMIHEGTFKLDASKEPKQIDVTPGDGPDKDKLLEGIYFLSKDELKLCIGHHSGDERPKDFESKEGSKGLLIVLKRDK
jgi:uncharacterized protein (TIGR03067 family)